MRKYLNGRRRYALLLLVGVGSLALMGAQCQPEPVKPPPPAPTGLSIDPTSRDFSPANGIQEFTVTNNGPSTSGTIHAARVGANPGDFPFDGTVDCEGRILADDETCSVKIAFDPLGSGPTEADLVVNSDHPADGEAVAHLTGSS